MTTPSSPWVQPDQPPAGNAGTGGGVFASGGPLGGSAPVDEVEHQPSDRRELVLVGFLFVAALVTGATSLMPWRDFGRRFGPTADETGWVNAGGSLGRGWVMVLLAVSLAAAGILIASGRGRKGRVLASGTGALIVLASIAEWGLGLGSVRSGPGSGLWVAFVIGVAVVVAVGALGPREPQP